MGMQDAARENPTRSWTTQLLPSFVNRSSRKVEIGQARFRYENFAGIGPIDSTVYTVGWHSETNDVTIVDELRPKSKWRSRQAPPEQHYRYLISSVVLLGRSLLSSPSSQ
jgi:hypothetical protein